MTLGPDLLLDNRGDLDLSSGDSQMGLSVSQACRIALLFVKGDWFLDLNAGIPYFENIWIKGPDFSQIKALFRAALVGVPGVQTITKLDLTLDKANRRLNVVWAVTTGNATINGHEVLST